MRGNQEAEAKLLRIDKHLNDSRRLALFGDAIDDYRMFVAAQKSVAACLRAVRGGESANYAQTEILAKAA